MSSKRWIAKRKQVCKRSYSQQYILEFNIENAWDENFGKFSGIQGTYLTSVDRGGDPTLMDRWW